MYYCKIFVFILVFYNVRHDKIRSVHILTSNNNDSISYLGTNFSTYSVVSSIYYKAMLRLNRRHFKFENFKLYVVSNCFIHEDYLDDSE